MTLENVLQFIEDNKDNEQTIRAIELATRPHIKRYRAAKKGEVAVITPTKGDLITTTDKDISPEASLLAKYMAQEVKKRYPWYTPRIDEWAKDIDNIHRLGCIGEQRKAAERFDWTTIKTVTAFSQLDPFWQQQVRSGANLRKHFNKLLIAAKAHYDKEQKNKVVKI